MPRKTRKQLTDPNEDRIQTRREQDLRDLQAEMRQRWRERDNLAAADTAVHPLVRELRNILATLPRRRRRDREMPERTTPCTVKGYTGRVPRQKPTTNRPKSRIERRTV